MDELLTHFSDYIRTCLPQSVKQAKLEHDQLIIEAEAADIVRVLTFLRDDSQCLFKQFVDIAGVDYPTRPQRFEVVYHLLSYKFNRRIRVKVQADDQTPVPSVSDVYSAATWFEREVWDMYGVLFSNHPDLRRILTDYGFDGHPQRRDFPLTGYVEMRYDPEHKRVVYEPVKLNQAYRHFDFLSPWEGPDYVLPGDEKAKDQA